MKYFNSLPTIIKNDYNNNVVLATNLLTRAYFLPSLLKNVTLFYEYDLREGDTPEIIAHKYYGNVYKYWIVLYSNGIIDPQSDWPLTSNQFELYLNDKYSVQANGTPVLSYTTSTVHHYEKIITIQNSNDMYTQNNTVIIDEDAYNSLSTSTVTRTLPDGSSVTQSISKSAISIYDYEVNLNEDKRKINIMKDIYVEPLENQFVKLMSV